MWRGKKKEKKKKMKWKDCIHVCHSCRSAPLEGMLWCCVMKHIITAEERHCAGLAMRLTSLFQTEEALLHVKGSFSVKGQKPPAACVPFTKASASRTRVCVCVCVAITFDLHLAVKDDRPSPQQWALGLFYTDALISTAALLICFASQTAGENATRRRLTFAH